jgi:transcription-repair coupling factor (superfamily II helicase)
LQAIAEASELGAGFQIAMRDLEIRGAGEILGARQSGHIAAVGFDLYCRLLASAIESKKENATINKSDTRLGFAPTIDLPLPAQIPEDYVPDAGLRLKLYRRLADIQTDAQVNEIAQELTDRFGKPPEQIDNLLYLLRVKVAAMCAHLASIAIEDGRIVIKYGRDDDALSARLMKRFKLRAGRDRAWLGEIDQTRKWQAKLLEVVRAMGV